MTARWFLALGAVLAAANLHAQASVAVSVSARVVTPCTTMMLHPRSTCSERVFLQQSDVRGAWARISAFGDDVRVRQVGGPQPKVELKGRQATLTF